MKHLFWLPTCACVVLAFFIPDQPVEEDSLNGLLIVYAAATILSVLSIPILSRVKLAYGYIIIAVQMLLALATFRVERTYEVESDIQITPAMTTESGV